MIAFDTYTKIAQEFERFGQINCCQRLLKDAQSPINRPIWSHWFTPHNTQIPNYRCVCTLRIVYGLLYFYESAVSVAEKGCRHRKRFSQGLGSSSQLPNGKNHGAPIGRFILRTSPQCLIYTFKARPSVNKCQSISFA